MNLPLIRVNHDLVNLYTSTDESLDIRFEYNFFSWLREFREIWVKRPLRLIPNFAILVYVSVVRYLDVETF